MHDIAEGGGRKNVIRWFEESRDMFALLPNVLDELVAAQDECARLREAVIEYRTENERLRAERAELADNLNNLVHQMSRPVSEFLQRLRVAQGELLPERPGHGG